MHLHFRLLALYVTFHTVVHCCSASPTHYPDPFISINHQGVEPRVFEVPAASSYNGQWRILLKTNDFITPARHACEVVSCYLLKVPITVLTTLARNPLT